jgi:hypothetical protein
MCGMRRENKSLRRETADIGTIEAQLRLLLRRGMQAVALLTGEYRTGQRGWAMEYVNPRARHRARLGFKHILINVGSMDPPEFAVLLDGIPRARRRQHRAQAYDVHVPGNVFAGGLREVHGNRRAQPARRLRPPLAELRSRVRRRHARGESRVLLGLNSDVGYELLALACTCKHLLARGHGSVRVGAAAQADLGRRLRRGVSDDKFTRMLALLRARGARAARSSSRRARAPPSSGASRPS